MAHGIRKCESSKGKSKRPKLMYSLLLTSKLVFDSLKAVATRKNSHLSLFISRLLPRLSKTDPKMKPNMVADEMFPEGAGTHMDLDEPRIASGLLLDLAANEKSVHADFLNDFGDIFDDDDLD